MRKMMDSATTLSREAAAVAAAAIDLINNNDIKFNKNAVELGGGATAGNVAAKMAFNRANGGTPKRRLSYNNSTPTVMEISSNNMATIQETARPVSPKGSTPPSFIKRKCLSKELGIKEPTSSMSSSASSASNNSSPFVIQSIKMDSTSPKFLNDSFETMKLSQLENGSGSRRTAQYLSRRATFSKHKSAPLSRLAFGEYFNSVCESASSAHAHALASIKSSPLSISAANILPPQPLNDIINHIHTRTSSNPNTAANMVKMPDDNSFIEEQQDHITDLENLIFGSGSQQPTASNSCKKTATSNDTNSAQLHNHQHFIKQSLDNDAAGQNLIGDKSREHILPVKAGAKHSDLHCIHPDTLVELLNGKYDDQIDEYIIIDSRYPYEYEGGHIAKALNIYTKDQLIEEMFFRRLHFKQMRKKITSSMSSSCLSSSCKTSSSSRDSSRMDYDDPEQRQQPEPQSNTTTGKSNKRVIIIFHCEFSSERGPTLLKFLRNQDRILNENVYPHLFYPELYLLEGGYKSFYETHKPYCEPQTYKPMLHEEHEADYKHFRAKAKSWEVSRHHLVLKEHLHQLTTEKRDHHDLDGSHMDINEVSTLDEEMVTDTPSQQIDHSEPPPSQLQTTHRTHPVVKMRTQIA